MTIKSLNQFRILKRQLASIFEGPPVPLHGVAGAERPCDRELFQMALSELHVSNYHFVSFDNVQN